VGSQDGLGGGGGVALGAVHRGQGELSHGRRRNAETRGFIVWGVRGKRYSDDRRWSENDKNTGSKNEVNNSLRERARARERERDFP
jgi:hypothetical protein